MLRKEFHQNIVDLSFLKTFQDPEHIARKKSIVDVLCKDEDGCTYIIEMQIANTGGFEERAQCKVYISQMNKGEKYEDLKKVIFLAFTKFPIFLKKKHYNSEHITLDKKTYEHDLDKLSFTFVDLVKLEKNRPKEIEKLSLEEKFYYFLSNAEEATPHDLQKLIDNNVILDKAFRELDRVYWTNDEIEMYEDREKGIKDNKTAMEHAVAKGKEEGRREGIMSFSK